MKLKNPSNPKIPSNEKKSNHQRIASDKLLVNQRVVEKTIEVEEIFSWYNENYPPEKVKILTKWWVRRITRE